MRTLAALSLAVLSHAAALGQTSAISETERKAAEADVRFIACPVYRDADAGKKSGCWLATNPATGLMHDVSLAPTKPDWNHEILVEGRAAGASTPCGGVLLEPVRVSVLPGACTRHMLPAEGYAGRRFVLPARNVRPPGEPRPPAMDPDKPATFTLLFDWDRSLVVYQLSDWMLDKAIWRIRQTKPSKVRITAWAATLPTTVSGRTLSESPTMAKTRALILKESLVRLGVDPAIIETRWKTKADTVATPLADGLIEPSRRRADIEVIP